MKKSFLLIGLFLGFINSSSAQLIVSKMLGKDAKNYGIGVGIFAFSEIPIASGNKSIVIEFLEFSYFPEKGKGGFFAAPSGKGHISFKAGYKNYFSEDGTGFYLQPSVGGAIVSLSKEDEADAEAAFGVTGALEGGYSLAVGRAFGQKINLGLKYEYSYAKETHQIQTLGLRLSYSFKLFGW
ncbi:MAG TPA: hypothetical protein VLC98_10780 [Phnomibacter sp.]|nr:hypothetical protein [Phnomibacter sp.]